MGNFLALLGVDRLEHLGHQLCLGTRCNSENVAVDVDSTLLVLGLRKHFSHSFQHTEALVAHHQLDPIQTTATEPLKEIDPTGLVFFHALNCTQNLAVAILVDRNGYIFKRSVPVAAQVDSIYINIRIPSTLQRTVRPILNVDIRFLIQFTDGKRRHLAAPQSLGNILHAPDGYACQVHLTESLFHATFTAAIPLNDSGLKGDSLKLGHLESDIPGSGSEVTAVAAAAIALTLLITLVPSGLGQFLCFGL